MTTKTFKMAKDRRERREPASGKTGKIFIYFPDKSFFCLLNYHYNSSTIPIAFIVKFWSESSEVTSSSTMKEESFEDYSMRTRLGG